MVEDIPKFGEVPASNPLAPPLKPKKTPRTDPTMTVRTGTGKVMALSKDLPLYRQPLLSVADKYKICLEEIERLRLEKAKEQARSSALLQTLAQFAKEGPEFQKKAKAGMKRADEAHIAVKPKDLVRVTLNSSREKRDA